MSVCMTHSHKASLLLLGSWQLSVQLVLLIAGCFTVVDVCNAYRSHHISVHGHHQLVSDVVAQCHYLCVC